MSSSTLPTHPHLTHPRTGEPLRALGFGKRGPIWPVLGGNGEEDGGDGGDDTTGGDAGKRSDSDGWKAPTSQEELDRIIQKRLDRERKNLTERYSDYDDLRAKADQWEALAAASKTDAERAVDEAREASWQAAMANTVPRVVAAEFKVEALRAGIAEQQLDALLEDMDLLKYADDDGDPDVERIRAKLAAFAPPRQEERRGPSSHGLGRRESTATGSTLASGRELYRSRHPQKTA